MLEHVTAAQGLLLFIAAAGIGFSKSGFAGVSMLHVVVFALIFGARESTGILLPMLVIGDVCAIWMFGKKVRWVHIQRLLPPSLVGVVIGWALMDVLSDQIFRPIVGCIILALTVIQIARLWRAEWFEAVPHQRWFALTLGLLAGITTMMANAAGPVVALYLLAVMLPKLELVGTSAWLFLILNISKLPFSYGLGLIDLQTLMIDVALAPAIPLGMITGRWLVHRISQKVFDSFLLAFTAVAAARLIGLF